MSVYPAKTQIRLGIRPTWPESSLCIQWVAKDQSFLHADSEDSDQTGRMPRLIWVFAGCTLILLVLSWGGSDFCAVAQLFCAGLCRPNNICDASSEFVSSSIPSWQILTRHAQPFRGALDLAFCLKVPLDSLLVWARSGGSGETANAQAHLNLRCSHRR